MKQSLTRFSLAFEFDSNCQALGWQAVRVEFKCFVLAPFSIENGAETIENSAETIENGVVFDRFGGKPEAWT